MFELPTNNTVTTDGEYIIVKARHPGRPVSIEIAGVLDGATVVPGYLARDLATFILDVGDDGLTRPKTAVGRWISSIPASGKVGISISGCTANTAVLVSVIDLLPR
jgi:hypothetical protein